MTGGCRARRISTLEPPPGAPREDSLLEAAHMIRERRIHAGDPWSAYAAGATRMPGPGCPPFSLREAGFHVLDYTSPLRTARSPLELVLAGRPTPLVGASGAPGLWLKLEWYNPLSLSIKDLTARALLNSTPPETPGLVEASSGNTGIALAALARLLGLRARILLPQGASETSRAALRLLGAELLETGASATVELLGEIRRITGEGYHHPDQFANTWNPLIHMRVTGRETAVQLEAVGARPRHAFLAAGTSGTVAGVGLVLGSLYGATIHVVVPERGSRIEGIRRPETGMRWLGLLEEAGVDVELVEVSREDALRGMVEAARRWGIIPGPSGGAVVAALLRRVQELGGGAVALLPDSGLKYPGALEEAARLADQSG